MVLFCGFIFIFTLYVSFPISASLTYKEEDLETISMGFSNKDKLVSIDLAYSTLYIAYGSNFKGDEKFLYHNRSFEEEDLGWINNFSISSRYSSDVIDYRNLFQNQYIELISIQNEKTRNGYIIHYQLVNAKKEEDLEAYNTFEISNQKIMYLIKKEKKDKKNYYEITSFLKIEEDLFLMVELEYTNKNRISDENIKELLLSLYQHIHIQKRGDIKGENNTTTKPSIAHPSSEETLLCVQKSIETNQNCNTTYRHNLTFKNNQFTKYVMETVITCNSKEEYQKIKSYYKRMKDVQFDDSKNTLTYFIGNGYEGTNGNEDLFKNKNMEASKVIINKYNLGSCEVKE